MSEMTCQKCQREVWIGANEPIKYCDGCAHEVAELSDDRIATLERELSEEKERIETVRKKARDDALEEARDIVDCVRFTTTAPEYEGETVEQAAQEMMRQIVELKDQPSGEA